MLVKNPKEVGLAIKDQRRALGLSQAELAAKMGVSRQWVIGVERGKRSTELDFVLKALSALGLKVDLSARESAPRPAKATRVDVGAILDRAREGGR